MYVFPLLVSMGAKQKVHFFLFHVGVSLFLSSLLEMIACNVKQTKWTALALQNTHLSPYIHDLQGEGTFRKTNQQQPASIGHVYLITRKYLDFWSLVSLFVVSTEVKDVKPNWKQALCEMGFLMEMKWIHLATGHFPPSLVNVSSVDFPHGFPNLVNLYLSFLLLLVAFIC